MVVNKIYTLETEEQVLAFAKDDICYECYYVDNDDEFWSGESLRNAILESCIDLDSFIGDIKEVSPGIFFRVESENVFYRDSEINLNGYTNTFGDYDSEEDAILIMGSRWTDIKDWEKNNTIISVYRCFERFGVDGFSINYELIGFMLKYDGREYVCTSDLYDYDIVFDIHKDIESGLDPECVTTFYGPNYYEKTCHDFKYKFMIDRDDWKDNHEISIDGCVEILA